MLNKILTCFFIFVSSMAMSQDISELQRINSKSKTMFVRPDVLDMLLIELRPFESNPQRTQDSLMLDTYQTIASAYMANNHFKKAYIVYYKFLERKKEMLAANKAAAIAKSMNSVSFRSQVDEKKEKELKDKLSTLQADNEKLESRRQSFKRNFSFLLIVLTGIFAIMLVSAGVRIMNLNNSLQQSRDRIKDIHRKAVIGKYSEGLKVSMKDNLAKLNEQAIELQQLVNNREQNPALKKINQLLNSLIKSIKEFRSQV